MSKILIKLELGTSLVKALKKNQNISVSDWIKFFTSSQKTRIEQLCGMKADRDFTRVELQQPGLRHLISGDFFLQENKNDFFLKRFMSEINIFKFGHSERFLKHDV